MTRMALTLRAPDDPARERFPRRMPRLHQQFVMPAHLGKGRLVDRCIRHRHGGAIDQPETTSLPEIRESCRMHHSLAGKPQQRRHQGFGGVAAARDRTRRSHVLQAGYTASHEAIHSMLAGAIRVQRLSEKHRQRLRRREQPLTMRRKGATRPDRASMNRSAGRTTRRRRLSEDCAVSRAVVARWRCT